MRPASFLTLGCGILLVVAACGGGATVTLAPGATLAPGTTPAPVVPTVAPPPVPVGNVCAGLPTFGLQTPQPTFAQDTALIALFPAQIDGQPVENVQGARWIEVLCFYSGEAAVQQFVSRLPNISFATLTYAFATVSVDDEDVSLGAFRTPGQDGNLIVQSFPQMVNAIGGSTDPVQGTMSNANIGGKNVSVWTEADGDVSYLYVIGDSVFGVGDVTESQAAKVFAALP